MRGVIFIITALLFNFSLFSQVEKRLLRKGNLHYSMSDFEKAAEFYGKSFDTLSTYNNAQFNLGNASYRLNKLDDAVYAFEMQANKLEDKDKKASAFHNLGNTYMQKFTEIMQLAQQASPDTAQKLAQGGVQFLQKSVDAYKHSLRNRSTDDETRHNLALAKKILEQFQQQNQNQSGGENNQNQNQDQDKNQEQQKEDQNQEKQEQQEGQNDQENKEEQQQNQDDQKEQEQQEGKEQEMKPHQISKEDAEKMLEALKNQEEKLHQKLKKRKKPAKAIIIEKDW